MPASSTLVAAYLAHLAEDRSLSVATIRLHKAALAAVHKTHGHDDPTDHEGVRRIMKGIARSHGRAQKQAKPLTAEALAAVRPTANTRRPLWETAGSRNRPREPPGAAGWTWSKRGVELPALMTARRWKNSKMPARYTERQAAGRGAVARYYQDNAVRQTLQKESTQQPISPPSYLSRPLAFLDPYLPRPLPS